VTPSLVAQSVRRTPGATRPKTPAEIGELVLATTHNIQKRLLGMKDVDPDTQRRMLREILKLALAELEIEAPA
jgi:hypothetical protein